MARVSRKKKAVTPDELFEMLPPSVRVGPYTVAIVPWDRACQDEQEAEGQFVSEREEINIGPMATCAHLVEIFLHELSHAIWWWYDFPDGDEERVVTGFGQAWAQIYRDNPWLLEWIRLGVTSD